jgi:thiamine kinase-like enzyme
MTDAKTRAVQLPCWQGAVDPQPLGGGITNVNFVVNDAGQKYVVRIGDDILVHQIMRFNELAASRAAHDAGISPEVVYAEPGAVVLRFIEGKTLAAEDIRQRPVLERIVPLLKRCHRDILRHLRGPVLTFWVFHVIRDYGHTLREGNSRMLPQLPDLLAKAEHLEQQVGPVELVFGHNDLLAANFIDDGKKIWLIDWDYAGFNSPLFDLGGLASNNELSTQDEEWLLETYFDKPLDNELRQRYHAMKCASLLREAMWSMVSEIHSGLDFDYAAYTEQNLSRFERVWRESEKSGRL